MPPQRPILIAGGGPVGVITALALARQGFAVEVFEAEQRVNDNPRAATTHAATLEILEALGLVDDVMARGLIEPKFRVWDRAARELIAEFDFGVLKDDTRYPFVVQCEQHKLATMTIERLGRLAHASVTFSSRIVDFEQFDDRVEAEVETPSGTRRVAGSYLIGCDGGRSTVRKTLGIDFEGFTHPERFLILTTPFAFDALYAQCSRNYFSDAQEWCALFKVTGDDGKGLWRLLFPTRPGETEEQAFDDHTVQQRLQNFFPKAGDYPVFHRNIYNVHQRVAATFRKGRVFLAGDSAHVNNPLGGLGLEFRHSRRRRACRIARPGHARRSARRQSRQLRSTAPAVERRICPAADHRQQEAARGKGPGSARPQQRGVAGDGGRSGGASRLSAARLADRECAKADSRRDYCACGCAV